MYGVSFVPAKKWMVHLYDVHVGQYTSAMDDGCYRIFKLISAPITFETTYAFWCL